MATDMISTDGGTFTITLPDEADAQSDKGAHFLTLLQAHTHQRGVKSLITHFQYYKYHLDLANTHWQAARKSVDVANGRRTPLQRVGDKGRSLRATAQRFYDSLTPTGLQMQCTLFQLDPTHYSDPAAVVAALVDKHMEMAQHA